ncbi:MAG: hydrolase [Acidobacteriota bacterium]
MPHPKLLDSSKTALVVIDMQEAFRSSIPDFAQIAGYISIAIRGCGVLGIPVIVTEQYPKGLGSTVEEVLFALPDDCKPIEKTAFSSCEASAFTDTLAALGTQQVVLCGIETHVCVNQSAHDLLDSGFDVHLLTDCVGSRFEHDKVAGLAKMQKSGVVPSSAEMMLFELMRDAKHEKFKEIQQLVK